MSNFLKKRNRRRNNTKKCKMESLESRELFSVDPAWFEVVQDREVTSLQADFDQSGTVDFADFLVLTPSQVSEVLSRESIEVLKGTGSPGQLLVRSESNGPDSAEALEAIDIIARAEPNAILEANVVPTDPRFSELWGLSNPSDTDIDAPEAWDLTQGSGNVVVGVIDFGIDYTHPDLVENMWRNTAEIEGNGIDDDGNGFVDDIFGYDFSTTMETPGTLVVMEPTLQEPSVLPRTQSESLACLPTSR